MNGRLDERSPADVLIAVQRLRAGGILRLQDRRAVRQAFIDPTGLIRFAVSGHPDESMTTLFREDGGVSDPGLRQATAAKRPDELLGTTLVRLGLLSGESLAQLTADHIRRVLRAALAMDEGTFEYQSGEFPFQDQMNGGVSVAEVLLEWSRGVRDVEWLRRRLGFPETLLRRASHPPEGYQNVPLDQSEGYMMSRVDGTTTVGEICLVSPLGEDVTLRALFGLVLSGILEMPEGGAKAAPPRPAATPGARLAKPATRPQPPAPRAEAKAVRPASPTASAAAPPATSAPPAATAPRAAAVAAAAPATTHAPPVVTGMVERVTPAIVSPLEDEMLQRHERLREQSLYDVLGIVRTSTPAQMRHAYYGLARRFHPDKFTREEVKAKAEQVFAHITEAYSTLSNAESRKRYDEEFALRGAGQHQEKSVDASELARLNFKRGMEHFDRGKYGEALAFMQNACEQDPSRAEHFHFLALTQARNPRWKKQAEENFLRAIRLSPSSADIYAHLGSHYARGGLHSKARESYQQALQWDPANEEARNGLEPDPGAHKGFLGIFGKK